MNRRRLAEMWFSTCHECFAAIPSFFCCKAGRQRKHQSGIGIWRRKTGHQKKTLSYIFGLICVINTDLFADNYQNETLEKFPENKNETRLYLTAISLCRLHHVTNYGLSSTCVKSPHAWPFLTCPSLSNVKRLCRWASNTTTTARPCWQSYNLFAATRARTHTIHYPKIVTVL